MRLLTRLAIVIFCLFLLGCSSAVESSKGPVKDISLDTKDVPENLTILLNEEPQTTQTNKSEVQLSVPVEQTGQVKVIDERAYGAITYQAEIPTESTEPIPLKIAPQENEEINKGVSEFLQGYFTAVNRKKNARSFLSADSIFNPEDLYNYRFQSAVLFTSSFKPFLIDEQPGLIVLVDAMQEGMPASTVTFQFRLLWEDGQWKIFHQRVLYEEFNGNLLFEIEEGSYPGKQSPGPQDIELSF